MAIASAPTRSSSLERVEGLGVVLRRPQPHHYDAWAELRAVSRPHLEPWEPTWAPDELSPAAYRRRLRRYGREFRQDLSAPFFIFRAEDDQLVGACNLNTIRRGVLQACSIGYWVGAPYQRQGYGLAAVRAAVRCAFETLDLHRVEAACIPTNRASRSLLEKAGFTYEGVARAYLKINGAWRDHVIYALLSSDPAWSAAGDGERAL
ncbi:MAG: GNAT family protein [Maricaulaceae bacterium]|jgi:ribosomal-protein-alanine N-acetyltransferase